MGRNNLAGRRAQCVDELASANGACKGYVEQQPRLGPCHNTNQRRRPHGCQHQIGAHRVHHQVSSVHQGTGMWAAARSDHEGQGPYPHQQEIDIRVEDEAEVGGRVARIPVRSGQEGGGLMPGPVRPHSNVTDNRTELDSVGYLGLCCIKFHHVLLLGLVCSPARTGLT